MPLDDTVAHVLPVTVPQIVDDTVGERDKEGLPLNDPVLVPQDDCDKLSVPEEDGV